MKQANSCDFFDFVTDDDICVNKAREGIETVLEDCLNAFSSEEVLLRYASVSLAEV